MKWDDKKGRGGVVREELDEPITDAEPTIASGPPDAMWSDRSPPGAAAASPPTAAAKLDIPRVPAAVAALLPQRTRDRGVFGYASSARFDALDAEGYAVLGIWTSDRPDAPGHAICARDGSLYFAKVAPEDRLQAAGRRIHNEMMVTWALYDRARRRRVGHRIAAAIDMGSRDGTAYLVQSWIAGTSIERLLEHAQVHREALPIELVLHIAHDAATALSEVHMVDEASGQLGNLVHGDVSSRSLILTESGAVRLVSWGFARRGGLPWQTREMSIGSVDAMTPEHARFAPLDQRSDIYALGTVVWAMLTGRPLLGSTDITAETAARIILEGTINPPSSLRGDVPPAVDRIVLRMLATRPEDRWTTARDLAEALGALLPARSPGDFRAMVRAADARSTAIVDRMIAAVRAKPQAAAAVHEFVVPVPYGRSFLQEDLPFQPGREMIAPAIVEPVRTPSALMQMTQPRASLVPPSVPPVFEAVPERSVRPTLVKSAYAVAGVAAVLLVLISTWRAEPKSRAVGLPFADLEIALARSSSITPAAYAQLQAAAERTQERLRGGATSAPTASLAALGPNPAPAAATAWLRGLRVIEQERRHRLLVWIDTETETIGELPARDERSHALVDRMEEEAQLWPETERSRFMSRTTVWRGQDASNHLELEQLVALFAALLAQVEP